MADDSLNNVGCGQAEAGTPGLSCRQFCFQIMETGNSTGSVLIFPKNALLTRTSSSQVQVPSENCRHFPGSPSPLENREKDSVQSWTLCTLMQTRTRAVEETKGKCQAHDPKEHIHAKHLTSFIIQKRHLVCHLYLKFPPNLTPGPNSLTVTRLPKL